MEENKMRRVYQSGKYAFGIGLSTASPMMVEICAYAGYGWVGIPAKYTSDILFLENMVRAAEAGGIATLARVTSPPDPFRIEAVLSTGVDAIMLDCESKQMAEDLVRMCRVRPIGTRRTAFVTRQMKYNMEGNTLEEYRRKVNQQVVVVFIVTMEGVEHCEEIFSVPGVEGVMTCSPVLCGELGVARMDPAVTKAKLRVAKAAKAAGVTYMPDARTPRLVLDWLETDGAKHIRTFSQAADVMMITRGFREMIKGDSEATEEGKLSERWSTFWDGR
jgi:2-keto-3-deoxy-L-rhamnonate aldolase RhmA